MDPAVVDLYQRIARTDGPDRTALMDELTARVLAAIQRETSGRVDPAIAALIARQPTGDAPDGRAAWDREVGALIGAVERRPDGLAPTADATGPVPFTGSIRLADGRLEIGWLTLGRASTGLPLLAAWLTDRGCGELTIRLTDADAVGA
jgi:hypothetical protein